VTTLIIMYHVILMVEIVAWTMLLQTTVMFANALEREILQLTLQVEQLLQVAQILLGLEMDIVMTLIIMSPVVLMVETVA